MGLKQCNFNLRILTKTDSFMRVSTVASLGGRTFLRSKSGQDFDLKPLAVHVMLIKLRSRITCTC